MYNMTEETLVANVFCPLVIPNLFGKRLSVIILSNDNNNFGNDNPYFPYPS